MKIYSGIIPGEFLPFNLNDFEFFIGRNFYGYGIVMCMYFTDVFNKHDL